MSTPTNIASEPLRLAEGDAFHGYVVLRLVGRGGAGSVYLVRHPVLDMQYALKILDATAAVKDETGVQRFLREARLATRIRHQNLVTVHDCGLDEERKAYFIVMDYVTGSTLREVLEFERRLEVPRAAEIVGQVAAALRATQPFHVVHRDIKPENIMIETDGRAKVLDLGIAKAVSVGDALRTRAGCMLGTPAYIAPEQALDSSDVDARADIYSLGIVFYEMLAGQSPYVGRTQTEILRQVLSDAPAPDVRAAAPAVDAGVAALIRRMMEKDRNSRIASFDAVLAELETVRRQPKAPVGPEPEAAPTATPVERQDAPAVASSVLASFAALVRRFRS